MIGTILFSCKALNKLLPNWVKSILLVGWRNILIRPMGLQRASGTLLLVTIKKALWSGIGREGRILSGERGGGKKVEEEKV